MSTAGQTVIAVLAALAAAASFGAGSALQHQQAHQPSAASVPPHRALAQLARRPRWLAGIALAAAAYGWQATALAFGPLALVAPIAATDLVFALALAAWWSQQRLRKRDLFGCGLVVGGVGCFLAASPPSPGRSAASAAGWLAAFTAVTVIAALAVGAGLAVHGTVRAGLLAAAGGVVFGLTAAVTLSFTRLLGDVGLVPALGSWEPWTLIALGATGMLLSVAAYQAGSLAASLPVIDTVEPIASVLIGTLVFGEHLAGSAGAMVIQFTAAAIAVAGILLLSPTAGKLGDAHGGGTSPHPSSRGTINSGRLPADRLCPVLRAPGTGAPCTGTSPCCPHTGRIRAAPWAAYMGAEEDDMPSTMTQTCALCGLRYANSALLELHIREDHVQQNQQAAPGRGDPAGSRAPQPDGGRPGSTAMAPRVPGSLEEVTAGTATSQPRRRLPGWLMTALRRSARVVRQAVQGVRYVNQELLHASEAISLRRAPQPHWPLQNGTDNDASPASKSPEPTRRAA